MESGLMPDRASISLVALSGIVSDLNQIALQGGPLLKFLLWLWMWHLLHLHLVPTNLCKT